MELLFIDWWVWLIGFVLLIFSSTLLILAEDKDYYECGNDWWAFVSFIAGFALFQFATSLNPFGWLRDNALVFAVFILVYFIVGFCWSIFKWFRFVRWAYKKYLQDKKYHTEPDSILKYFEDYPPNVNKNKARIIRWIIAWPISVFWAVTKDLVVWIAEKLYNLAGRFYKKIADIIFAELIKEREQIQKEKELQLERKEAIEKKEKEEFEEKMRSAKLLK